MISHKAIELSISRGIGRAARFLHATLPYEPAEDMLRKSGTSRRSEHVLTSFIADELRSEVSETGGFVTHETRHFLLESALRKKLGSEAKSMGHVYDLVVWNQKYQPYALIEVKLARKARIIVPDAVKMCRALGVLGTKSAGTVRNAFLAFWSQHVDWAPEKDLLSVALDEVNERLLEERLILERASKGRVDVEIGMGGVIRIPSSILK